MARNHHGYIAPLRKAEGAVKVADGRFALETETSDGQAQPHEGQAEAPPEVMKGGQAQPGYGTSRSGTGARLLGGSVQALPSVT